MATQPPNSTGSYKASRGPFHYFILQCLRQIQVLLFLLLLQAMSYPKSSTAHARHGPEIPRIVFINIGSFINIGFWSCVPVQRLKPVMRICGASYTWCSFIILSDQSESISVKNSTGLTFENATTLIWTMAGLLTALSKFCQLHYQKSKCQGTKLFPSDLFNV